MTIFAFSSPLLVEMKISTKINLVNLSKPALGKTEDMQTYLGYLKSRANYYKNAKASALTEWQNERDINLADNDISTLWMGDRLHWHDEHSDSITVDLKKSRSVGAVALSYFSRRRVPTDYKYQCSLDGKEWLDIGHFTFKPTLDSGVIFNKVKSSNCRFVKLHILASPEDDSPELSEIEVIDNQFRDIDVVKAQEIQKDPFKFIKTHLDLQLLLNYLSKNGISTQACFYTNKSSTPFCQSITIFPNSTRIYTLIIPPNGTSLDSIKIVAPDQVIVNIDQTKILPLTLSQLEKKNYIPIFKEK